MKSDDGNFGNFTETKSEEDYKGGFGTFDEPAEKVESEQQDDNFGNFNEQAQESGSPSSAKEKPQEND